MLQPRAVERLTTNNFQLTTDLLNELCFQYRYDKRGRMITKKVPGAGEVYMVYDGRDRLIMSQDATQRSLGKWLVTVYDAWNRPIQTGLWQNNELAHQHRQAAENSLTYPITTSGFELLTENYYDSYNWLNGLNLPLNATLENNIHTLGGFYTQFNTAPLYARALVQDALVQGKLTGTKTRILGTGNFLYSLPVYDDKNRVIQTQSTNIGGGKDVVTTQYNWAGAPLKIWQHHQKAGTGNTLNLYTRLEYDDGGRLLRTWKRINHEAVEKLLLEQNYHETGQIAVKKLLPAYNGGAGLETQQLEYNIRGWLKGMNRNCLSSGNSAAAWFGYELGYDQPATAISGANYSNPQYNGNISGTVWRSRGDGERRRYDFNYDAANRLLAADFNQYSNGSFNKSAGLDFSMKMGDGQNPFSAYDANGNILFMQQKGWKINGGSAWIDQLSYTYQSQSNKLLQVSDAANDPQSRLGDFKEGTNTGSDYAYDANGNLTLDRNKGIDSIEYNYLNLPQKIVVPGKGSIEYSYDAAGNKLKKTVTDNLCTPARITTTLYINGIEYRNDTLQQIAHEEGRIRPANNSQLTTNNFILDFFLKDHLGNIRAVLTEQKDTLRYMATMETAYRASEIQLFANVEETAHPVAQISQYPNDNTTQPNQYTARTNGNNKPIGPSATLKVMAGDQIAIKVNSWWKYNWGQSFTPPAGLNMLAEVVNAMATGFGALPGSKATTPQLTGGALDNVSALLAQQTATFLINQYSTVSNGRPKAFVNWVLFDEQFNYVATGSGYEQIGEDNILKTHLKPSLPIGKSGYLYIYVSNESPVDVFFDNLQITHLPGALLEETHYYPFGLAMAGISSKAAGRLENRRKFNGYELQKDEFIDGISLDWYDYKHRFYNHQIGRFFSTDRLANQYPFYSPYQFAGNEPTVAIDLDGLEPAYIASKNKSGQTKLNFSVIALFAKLYGNSFWKSGLQANIVINQSIHDKITKYKSGALTLGFEINYTSNYQSNADGEDWLKLTSHEIVHVQQFTDIFGSKFESEKDYEKAVSLWMFLYGADIIAKVIENRTINSNELHDKMEIEQEANDYEKYFRTFFDSQNYTYKVHGRSYLGNNVINLLYQISLAHDKKDKKSYSELLNQLLLLAENFNKSQPKKPGR